VPPKNLRTGFSTGTAASAASGAALVYLLTGRALESIDVDLPGGAILAVAIKNVEKLSDGGVRATVIKDAGDDPDVTHGAAISAKVHRLDRQSNSDEIVIAGGSGVGTVTRPGLPVPVGDPAINPVPRTMIEAAIRRAWQESGEPGPVRVETVIEVEGGEKLAMRTLNPRLGIKDGISILGTTGLVKPFSHEAYTATIDSALDVVQAAGIDEIVLTTGGKSEKFAMAMRPDLPEASFIQMADFFHYALTQARDRPLRRIGVVSFFGKAVKQSQGLKYTHAHKAAMDLKTLAEWLVAAGADSEMTSLVAEANTARHALEILREHKALDLTSAVGKRMLETVREFAGPNPDVWVAVLDNDGRILWQGEGGGQA
jgi:cobalt-precorrin-5B (C1)-methyltransferase